MGRIPFSSYSWLLLSFLSSNINTRSSIRSKSPLYIHNEDHRIYIRKLLALAFIPVDLIPQIVDTLKQNC